jgi:hypothetical protein
MSPTEIRLLLDTLLPFLVAIVALGAGGRIVTAWIRSRGSGGTQKQLQAIAEQLRQLQESVDTMAIEVERVEEAQRFNAKLLSEGRSQSRHGTP